MIDTPKHTPGPWVWQHDLNSGPRWCSIMTKVSGELRYIADAYTGEADARLIASAPELLEALKRVRSTMSSKCTSDGCTCGDGWQHDDPEVIAKIDAVIAKAEGRQS